MDKKILRFLFRTMVLFFIIIFVMGFFSEILKPVLLPNVNVAAMGNSGIKRRVKQTGTIEPLRSVTIRCLETVEILELAAKKGMTVLAGDPLFRVRLRANAGGVESYRALENAFQSLDDQVQRLVFDMNHSEESVADAWRQMTEMEDDLQIMESMQELGLISDQDFQSWNKELQDMRMIWDQSVDDRENRLRWKEQERVLLTEKLENMAARLEEMRSQCIMKMDENGWVRAEFDGIVMSVPEINCCIASMEPIMEVAEVTDYKSVKLVTEISLSDYQWVGDSLLVYIRTPKGLLKTYTENVYQTDHQTVVFESLFNKAYEDEIRIGQSYDTMIEKQQRFLSTITIPKTLISAPGGFYNRGMGSVKVIRQESGILGDEFFVEEVPIRLVVVGDERVITLPIGGLVILNGDDLEAGTKVFINQ